MINDGSQYINMNYMPILYMYNDTTGKFVFRQD